MSVLTKPVTIRPLSEPVGPLKLLFTIARNPVEAIPAAAYTSAVSRRRILKRDVLYVSDPDLIKQLLVEQEGIFFNKSVALRRALKPALGEALLTGEGTHWRWQRLASAPIFRHDRLLGFLPSMLTAAERTRSAWASRANGSDGVRLDMMHEMLRTSYAIVAETMMSGAPGISQKQVEQAVDEYLDSFPWNVAAALFGIPRWVPYPKRRSGAVSIRFLREALLRIVDQRRREQNDGDVSRAGSDLVHLLVTARDPETDRGMSDGEIADNLMTFISAGHETSAVAITWAFYLVASHPEVEARVLEEIERITQGDPLRPEHVARLTYTKQVVQEALRLYPPVPQFSRMAIADTRLGDMEVKAGSVVYVPVFALHRHNSIWEDPDNFDPDRFRPDRVKARHRYAYMPFGAGPRICIGMSFALMEAVTILSVLLRSMRVSLPPGTAPSPRHRVTIRPDGGLWVNVRSRN